jgi:hypothetical protein
MNMVYMTLYTNVGLIIAFLTRSKKIGKFQEVTGSLTLQRERNASLLFGRNRQLLKGKY